MKGLWTLLRGAFEPLVKGGSSEAGLINSYIMTGRMIWVLIIAIAAGIVVVAWLS